MKYAQEKLVAVAAVTAAATLCEQVRKELDLTTIAKADQSPVTVADFGSQAVICQALSTAFPQEEIIAEEDAKILQQPTMVDCLGEVTRYVQKMIPDAIAPQVIDWINLGNGKLAQRYWTLDPIDGTKGFIRGDQYAIALALIEQGEVKIGVLGCPALPVDPAQPQGDKGVLFIAIKNQGTEMIPLRGGNSQTLRVNRWDDPSKLRVIESVESSHSDRTKQTQLAQKLKFSQPALRIDSQAKYGAVARGDADLYMRIPRAEYESRRENIWDHAAGAIVVTEAGGKVTDLQGLPLDFSVGAKLSNNYGILVSNRMIHQQVLSAWQEI